MTSAEISPVTNSKLGLTFSGFSIANPHHPTRIEDALFINEKAGLMMVFDGVGSFPQPEVGSRKACEYLAKKLIDYEVKDIEQAKKYINKIFQQANLLMFRYQSATTATVAKFFTLDQKLQVLIGHIGDSRAYLYRPNVFFQLTDDSRGNSVYDLKEALGFNLLGVNTRIYHREVKEGEIILLSTDGYHDNVSDEKTERFLKRHKGVDAKKMVESLCVELRKPDDITFALAKAE